MRRKFVLLLLLLLAICSAGLGVAMLAWSLTTAYHGNEELGVVQIFGGFVLLGLALVIQVFRGKITFNNSYKQHRLEQRRQF